MSTLVATGSLRLLRRTLALKKKLPGVANFLIPYVSQTANSLLLNVSKSLQEKLIRETLLVPNENIDDTEVWKNDNPTRAWIRKWWLTHNFRGTQQYHNAASALYDQSMLPTLRTTKKMFKMEHWKSGRTGNRYVLYINSCSLGFAADSNVGVSLTFVFYLIIFFPWSCRKFSSG